MPVISPNMQEWRHHLSVWAHCSKVLARWCLLVSSSSSMQRIFEGHKDVFSDCPH